MIKKICIAFVSVFIKCVFRVKTIGAQNVPKESGAILALNHRSNWDVVVASVTCPRALRFMAKSELFKNRLFGRFISALGAFPVKRNKGDIGAIKSAAAILKDENIMLIFPEGRRADNDNLKAKPGMVLISQMTGVPIIPAYISGKYKFMNRITVAYGEPIYPVGEKLDSAQLQERADDIMQRIRELKVE